MVKARLQEGSKKMKRSAFLAMLNAGLATAVSAGAFAQGAPSPFYLRAEVGYSWSKDADIRDAGSTPGSFLFCGNGPCSAPGPLNDIGDSYVIGAGVGYRVAPNIRTELALAYRGDFDLDQSDAGAPPTTFRGKIRSWSLMLNGYYDFEVGGPWKPYVAAGLGVARNEVKTISATNPAAATLPALFSNFQLEGDTDTGFAWTLGAGVGYAVTPRMTLELGYRFVDLGDLKIPSQTVLFNTGPQSYPGAKGELKSHEVTLGFRF
jgi:opacity protein-like surface antigen